MANFTKEQIEYLKTEFNVSRETLSRISQYQELLISENENLNLIGKSTIEDFYNRHILDSLQLLKFIKNKSIPLIDLGTGAGIPGIILSIAGISEVILIESKTKKCNFLENASKISNNSIKIINSRIEEIENLGIVNITARAFAPLEKIFKTSYDLLTTANQIILLKGQNINEEVKIAKKNWKFNLKLYDSIAARDSKIIEIFNLQYGGNSNRKPKRRSR
jgi:16S rRNA (guanine527-N7)-methyltransferase